MRNSADFIKTLVDRFAGLTPEARMEITRRMLCSDEPESNKAQRGERGKSLIEQFRDEVEKFYAENLHPCSHHIAHLDFGCA